MVGHAMSGFDKATSRGFGYSEFSSTHPDYPGPLSVQASSLATARCLWIGVASECAHLGEDQVRRLRDLLTAWLSEDEGDLRECSRCGDEVQILNSRDECSGCEEERANGAVCKRCDQTIDWSTDMRAYRTKKGNSICGSCHHNARRSG